MATLAGIVAETYDLIYGIAQAERPAEDTITAELATAATSMTPATDAMWHKDDYAEFDDGELVICVADASTTVNVRRAQRGTTDATHSSGSVIRKNPLYPRYAIERLVSEVIDLDLWPYVWTWHKDTVTYIDADHMYDLDAYIEDVVSVYQADLNNDDRFHPIPRSGWDVERQIATAVSANNNLLRLREPRDPDSTVYYTAKRRPAVADIANLDDKVASIVKWGAAGKLSAARSRAPRYDPSHQLRQQEEGADFRDFRGFMTEFLRLRGELAAQLRLEVPTERVFRPKNRRRSW